MEFPSVFLPGQGWVIISVEARLGIPERLGVQVIVGGVSDRVEGCRNMVPGVQVRTGETLAWLKVPRMLV